MNHKNHEIEKDNPPHPNIMKLEDLMEVVPESPSKTAKISPIIKQIDYTNANRKAPDKEKFYCHHFKSREHWINQFTMLQWMEIVLDKTRCTQKLRITTLHDKVSI